MSNRYETPGEIAGAKRRTNNWRQKMQADGFKYRGYWVTDSEHQILKSTIEEVRQSEAPVAKKNEQ